MGNVHYIRLRKNSKSGRTHSGFETQRRCHQKSKTGVPVAPQKRTCVRQNLLKTRRQFESRLRTAHSRSGYVPGGGGGGHLVDKVGTKDPPLPPWWHIWWTKLELRTPPPPPWWHIWWTKLELRTPLPPPPVNRRTETLKT